MSTQTSEKVTPASDVQVIKRIKYIKCIKCTLAALANVAIIGGVFFAVWQYREAVEIDHRQTSIAILKPTREESVLKSLRRLIVALHEHPDPTYTTAELTADADLVLNTYDSIAIHYFFDAVDQCLVKEHVYTVLPDVVQAIKARGYPDNSLRRISALKTQLDKRICKNTIY